MKNKCFFCNKYSINIKNHIKNQCINFIQISDDVFYNYIISFVRLQKITDCVNRKLRKFGKLNCILNTCSFTYQNNTKNYILYSVMNSKDFDNNNYNNFLKKRFSIFFDKDKDNDVLELISISSTNYLKYVTYIYDSSITFCEVLYTHNNIRTYYEYTILTKPLLNNKNKFNKWYIQYILDIQKYIKRIILLKKNITFI